MKPLLILVSALLAAAPASAHLRVTLLAHHAAIKAQTTMLVTPQDQPVGGEWQRWINAIPMPTYRGTMVLDVSTADSHKFCDWSGIRVLACTGQPGSLPNLSSALASAPETIIDPLGNNIAGGERESLIYEQAHVVDFAYLTDPERLQLMYLFRHQFAYRVRPDETVQQAWWEGEAQFASGSTYPAGELFAQIYADCAWRSHQTWLDLGAELPSQGTAACRFISRVAAG